MPQLIAPIMFLVTQEPKRGQREGYVVKVAVVGAHSAREALELTGRHWEDESGIFKKPQARPLDLNHCYRL